MITNKDWDCLAAINNTDLYGLLNILFSVTGEEEDAIDKLNQLKEVFTSEKRLWKARILDMPKNKNSVCLSPKEYYTDVREMSVEEAIEWYNDLKEHLNDFKSVYDSDARGLYYKKDGEWVLFTGSMKKKGE